MFSEPLRGPVAGQQRLLGLEEALLGRLLFHGDLDVRVLRRLAGVTARNDTAQPLVAVVLLLGVKRMVGTIVMRRIDTINTLSMRLAPAQQPARLATALEQVRKRTTRARLNVQHAPQCRS